MKIIKNRFVEKIINCLLNILIFIFGVILLVSIYTGFQTKVLGSPYANFFGYSMFEVQTGSMAEAINPGDWIVVKLGSKVKIKDVVTYELEGQFITHRIIEVYDKSYVTKGDANSSKDKPISHDQIIGKVVSVLANLGLVRKILFNPAVLISLIITLFLFSIAIKKNNQAHAPKTEKKKTNVIYEKIVPVISKVKKIKIKKEKVKDVVEDDFKDDNYYKDDDLDKTSLYRVISVENGEIDKTLHEISKTKAREDFRRLPLVVKVKKVVAVILRVLKKAWDFIAAIYKKASLAVRAYIKKQLQAIYKVLKKIGHFFIKLIKQIILDVVIVFKSIGLLIFTIIKKIVLFPIVVAKKIKLFIEDVREFQDLRRSKRNGTVSIIKMESNVVAPTIAEIKSDNVGQVMDIQTIEEQVLGTEEVQSVEDIVDEDVYREEDDLDKTSFYRVISVDSSEIDNTLFEIAQNEINEKDKKDQDEQLEVPVQQPVAIEEVEEDTLTAINLDLLESKKGSKKGKNIIDTAMIFKKEQITELLDILIEDDKMHKPTIRDMFITAYIDAKFYNYYGEKEVSGKTSIKKIENAIEEVVLASEIISSYNDKDSKRNDIIDIYAKTIILIANLTEAFESITDSKAKKEFYKKHVKKYAETETYDWKSKKIDQVISNIMNVQKNYADLLECFTKSLETSMFSLLLDKISSRKDMYKVDLQHNIEFNKVYSDYIIDKTYTEGIVAEDKIAVMLTLLSVRLIKDMSFGDFNKKYVVYIPDSLYSKEKKLDKLLRMFDDKYAKENIIILIAYKDFANHKRIVKRIKKMGYRFAFTFDSTIMFDEKDKGNIYIADYIFLNKKADNTSAILSIIPEELLENVIYEVITDKVEDIGSE